MAINVASLPAYVEERRLPIISKIILGAKTAELLTLATDVKGKTALNLLNTEVVFGDGSTCGWNEAGTSTLSQRYIDPAILKVKLIYFFIYGLMEVTRKMISITTLLTIVNTLLLTIFGVN